MGGPGKNKQRDRQLRAGHGAVGETPIAGLKDWATNVVRVKVVLDNCNEAPQVFVRGHLEPGNRLYTDEAAAYKGLAEYRHACINHGRGEYGRGSVNTNGIESFWALFRRRLGGTCHSMSPRHLHHHAREFSHRHKSRLELVNAVTVRAHARRRLVEQPL